MSLQSINASAYNPSSQSQNNDQYVDVLNKVETINNKRSTDKDIYKQKITLKQLIVNIKSQKIKQIYIHKVRRALTTKPPIQIVKNDKIQESCGISIYKIQFPDQIVHFVVFLYVIVILSLLVLSTLDGFIQNFNSQRNSLTVLIIKIVCLLINSIYFILKCTNGSFGKSRNTIYIHQTLKTYAKTGRLAIDFIMILFQILTLIFPNIQTIPGVFFFYLVFVLLITISDFIHIETAYIHSENAFLIWGLIKVCLANIIIAHIMASIILAMSFIDTQKSWMVKAGIHDQQWWVKYIYAFYWGITIMMTVGFGDILPGNPREIVITSFLEMFSCIVLAYNISEIGSLISQIRIRTDSVNRKIAIFDRIIKSNKKQYALDTSLQQDIFNHIKWSDRYILHYEHKKQFISQLPEHLRHRYYKQANKNIFGRVLFFKDLTHNTKQKIAEKITSEFYYQRERLLENNTKILILQQGKIGYSYKRQGSSRNGQINGEISAQIGSQTKLLTFSFMSLCQNRNYDLIAKQSSIVWHIEVQELRSCMLQSSIDFQHFFGIQHKHCLDEDEWETAECLRCSKFGNKIFHVVYNCPRVVYKPLRQVIVHRHLTDLKQCPRAKNFRRERNQYSKTSTLLHKIILKTLFQKISHLRNSQVNTFIDQQPNRLNFGETYSKSRSENDILQLKKRASENLQIIKMKEIINLLQMTIRGDQRKFWDLEVDCLNNFLFYFPNHNPNSLKKYCLYKKNLSHLSAIQRRKHVLCKQDPIKLSVRNTK